MQNREGDVKYSIGNRVAQELMIHVHEQLCGVSLMQWGLPGRGGQKGKVGQLYSIINKI